MRSTPSLSFLSSPLGSREVLLVMISNKGQIELFNNLLDWKIFNCVPINLLKLAIFETS